ncbi:hypothetical protein QWI33_25740 [Glycomyces tritici]|uniref:Uncharacterized protein n=1 Tax=Glycomyces tritici TaxID=2665176 RepID=A0ABT7YWY5_9ACTN|nr:hypothetical protein [Glycomyces tritici]MDN3243151.1 hypothetical protein [Glycomyces tritici]
MAVYGLAAVFLYQLPTSLVSVELDSGWNGGVYKWVSEGISAPIGAGARRSSSRSAKTGAVAD